MTQTVQAWLIAQSPNGVPEARRLDRLLCIGMLTRRKASDRWSLSSTTRRRISNQSVDSVQLNIRYLVLQKFNISLVA